MLKLLLASFLLLSSCNKNTVTDSIAHFEVTDIANEQMIPKKLLLQIENEHKDEAFSSSPNYSFVPLKVLLTDEGGHVLKDPSMQFNFPKGGGSLDLKKTLIGDGSFYLSFPEEQFKEQADKNNKLVHLFYISNSPKAKIQNEVYGLGCGRWTDLKDSLSNLQQSDFLKINTYNLRYLRVLAGTYIFVFKENQNVSLAQLTISDSRYTKDLCLGAVSEPN